MGLINIGPFVGLQVGEYISGTRAGITGGGEPFNFDFGFDFGDQNFIGGTGKFSYVWPVLDRDVTAVPLPTTLWMLAASFAGLWLSQRTRILNSIRTSTSWLAYDLPIGAQSVRIDNCPVIPA